MDVVIYGNGAHGKDIAADVAASDHDNGPRRVRFYDDTPSRSDAAYLSLLVANHAVAPKCCRFIIGVNDSRTRRHIAELVERHVGDLGSGQWVHRTANVGPDVTYGEHTHINAGAFLTRCTLGDFVTVGPNATICGDVTIGDDVMIGAGAVIKNLLTIGDGAVIGCGAVVVKDVPAGVTVVGNPAEVKGKAK